MGLNKMPTKTYKALATVTLSGTDSEIQFSSIPSTYRDLVLIASFSRSDITSTNAFMKLNNSSSDFSNVQMFGNGSAGFSGTGSDGRVATYHGTTGRIYNVILNIMDYSASDKHKTTLSRYNSDNGGVGAFAVRWAQTSVVDSVSFYVTSGNFEANSIFTLYGIES